MSEKFYTKRATELYIDILKSFEYQLQKLKEMLIENLKICKDEKEQERIIKDLYKNELLKDEIQSEIESNEMYNELIKE